MGWGFSEGEKKCIPPLNFLAIYFLCVQITAVAKAESFSGLFLLGLHLDGELDSAQEVTVSLNLLESGGPVTSGRVVIEPGTCRTGGRCYIACASASLGVGNGRIEVFRTGLEDDKEEIVKQFCPF